MTETVLSSALILLLGSVYWHITPSFKDLSAACTMLFTDAVIKSILHDLDRSQYNLEHECFTFSRYSTYLSHKINVYNKQITDL